MSEQLIAENATELYNYLGVPPAEGVVVAIFPRRIQRVALTGEEFSLDAGTDVRGVVANLGTFGGDRLLDLFGGMDFKWWKVKEFAAFHGFELVATSYQGPISEVPDRFFDLGEGVLGVRFYQHGPWFWPGVQPEVELDEDAEERDVERLAAKLGLIRDHAGGAGALEDGIFGVAEGGDIEGGGEPEQDDDPERRELNFDDL